MLPTVSALEAPFWATRRAGAAAFVALALAFCLLADVARAELTLQPGDRVRMSISGLPEAVFVSVVDAEGKVRFPIVGTIAALDRTEDELTELARELSNGRVYKRYGDNGLLVPITLGAEDVYITVEAYRPIVVTGDVQAPREIPYRPGLTVRAAIAIAGGIGQAAGAGLLDATQVTRTQADYEDLVLARARELAEEWRLSAQLRGERNPEPPNPAALRVPQTVFMGMVSEERALLDGEWEAYDQEKAYLESAITQAEERLRILKVQEEQQERAVEADEEEQKRIEDLAERGLMQATRAVEVRRAVLLSSTRRLETQNNIARVSTEILNLRRQLKALDENWRTERHRQLGITRQELRRMGSRIAAVQDILELYGSGAVVGLNEADAIVTVTMHRHQQGSMESFAAAMDEGLLPGDVIDVQQDFPDDALLAQ